MMPTNDGPPRSAERGSVLILALVFLLAVGLVTTATAGLAISAGANTTNARNQQVAQANVESLASLAIQATRVTYYYSSTCTSSCYASSGFSTAITCTPSTAATAGLGAWTVWCEGSGGSANGLATRTVDFYVCTSGVNPCVSSSRVALFAEVEYLDLPAGEAQTANQCSATRSATCGISVSVTSWDVRLADQ